jgi:hypothetical protein
MNYVDFMRKVDGRAGPKVDTSGFQYTGRMPVSPAHIRAVLNEERHTAIQDAFSWCGTSILDEWYETIYCGEKPTPTQKAYLEWMLEEYS